MTSLFFGWVYDISWDQLLVPEGWGAALLPPLRSWSLIMLFPSFLPVPCYSGDKFSKNPPAVLRLWKELRLGVRAWIAVASYFLPCLPLNGSCANYMHTLSILGWFLGAFTAVGELWTNHFKLVTLVNAIFSVFFSLQNQVPQCPL